MARLEFYLYEGELWYKDTDGNNILFDQTQTGLVDSLLCAIKKSYPDAYDALVEEYKDSSPNKRYYRYKMVKRFLRCNFGTLDSTYFDIEDVKMNFERVACPLRLECKYDGKICSPIYRTTLTDQEMRVGRLWYDGLTKEEIAGMLFISPETVNNHIRNIYGKLGIHEKSDFVKYVNEHDLYRNR